MCTAPCSTDPLPGLRALGVDGADDPPPSLVLLLLLLIVVLMVVVLLALLESAGSGLSGGFRLTPTRLLWAQAAGTGI